MNRAIETVGLTKNYGPFTLGPVDLALPGGTILGLIGENGAGKSTLIKCLLGIVRPSGGQAKLLGRPAAEALGGVGYVPDECPFPGALKVRQTGGFLSGVFPGWDGALFGEYLKKFDLPGERKIKDLSRGMKMKLTIAAALSHRPRLLILDEATAGLDPVVRDEILDEFLAFVEDEDHAVLISSHITSDLEKLCDYVAYLHQGRLTVQGPKDELLECYGKVACTREQLERIDPAILVGRREGEYGCQALVSDRAALRKGCPDLAVDRCTLEDIMIFTTRGERK